MTKEIQEAQRPMLLEVKNLSKKFGNQEVLKDISFTMERGEVLAIIGSSGSGKSTLLRILNSLETADNGILKMNGRIGLIFQNFNLFPHLNLQNNIVLALVKVQRKTKADAKRICAKYLKLVGLTGNEKKYPCELSGGMQQRAAIARALALEPKILCFDEPTSALDPELTFEVLKVIKDLKTLGRTMIIVTHEMTFARDVADNILFMDNGTVAEYGEAVEVYNTPKSERLKEFMQRVSR